MDIKRLHNSPQIIFFAIIVAFVFCLPKTASAADLTIGLVSDAHAEGSDTFNRIGTAARSIRANGANIIINLGDLIESRRKGDRISKKDATIDFKRANSLLSRQLPIYHVIGQHEVMSMSKDDLKALTGQTNRFAVKFRSYNLIFLDANFTKDGKSIDAKNRKNVYKGFIPNGQLDWLKDQLKNTDNNIIFSHQPLYNLDNKDDLEDILKNRKKKIIAAFHGHKHPGELRTKSFGGIKHYDIPSLRHKSKTFSIARITGNKAKVFTQK